jgi:hypothetical protein
MDTLDPEAGRLTHLWRGMKEMLKKGGKVKAEIKKKRRLFVWSWSCE